MPKQICGKCGRGMIPKTNGVDAIEFFNATKDAEYRIWRADVLQCPECDNKIIVLADKPFAEHFQENFQDVLKRARTAHWVEFY